MKTRKPHGQSAFSRTPAGKTVRARKRPRGDFNNGRYCDPAIARFVSADNVIDGELDTQGWNAFSYVKGNPIRYEDPTGHVLLESNGLSAATTPYAAARAIATAPAVTAGREAIRFRVRV